MINPSNSNLSGQTPENRTESRPLADAAKRALAEAEARRVVYLESEATLPREIGGRGGRGGREPGRYGDWEVKGLTSDF